MKPKITFEEQEELLTLIETYHACGYNLGKSDALGQNYEGNAAEVWAKINERLKELAE